MVTETIRDLTQWLSILIDAAAVILIGFAVLGALCRSILVSLGQTLRWSGAARPGETTEDTRLRLARSLALALELLLAADIMRTAIAPSWEEIGMLAAIAALRTALNFFLQREIDSQARRTANNLAPSSPGIPAVCSRPPGAEGAPGVGP